jgi:nucleotide-binding universal stress UspA family protein
VKSLFKRIVCPIDFDANSITALKLARDLATDPEATLYLLHVVGVVLAGFPKQFHAYPMTEHDARSRLQDIAREHLEGNVRYQVLTRTGDPASEILRAVREIGADSVVMPTHGRTGLDHFLLGSVGERVVRESTRPVLTIKVPAQ